MEKAEKISVSDLSIGDYVRVKMCKWDYDDPDTLDARVLSIEGNSVGVGYDNRDILMSAFVDDLQPIPITAEVLDKNGFVDNGVGQHYLKCGNGITVRVGRSPLFHDGCWLVATDKQVDETISTTCVLFNARHIHELQRALRLAKVEKEIVV
ncbi:MAG: hypothetical protein J6V21_08675 [Alistipes sp.]|nr:hypothetical protein [Alistipes sp.]